MLRLAPLVMLHEGSLSEPLRPGELALRTISSAAFGDGSHPTTRLCAGAVEFLCRQKPLDGVLDVGTGTGVLARIARARGARFIAATDIDPIALEAARTNAALDPSSEGILICDLPPDHWGARFELVVANILEEPLRQLAAPLSRALDSSGTLLVSGFTRVQAPALREAFAREGLTHVSDARLDEWVMSTFRSTRGR